MAMAKEDEDAGIEIEMPMPIIETQKADYDEEGTPPNVNDDSGGDGTTSSEAEEEVDLKNSNNNNMTRGETVKKVLSSDIAFVIALLLLLCIGLAIGLGVALGGQGEGSSTANSAFTAEYDAIVVGAGWSGIRAAQTLQDADVNSFLVLEANDYVGGRSKSVNSDGSTNEADKVNDLSNVPIEMGSEWLYYDGAVYSEMEDYLIKNQLLDNIDLDYKDDLWLSAYTQPLTYIQSIDADTGNITIESISDEEVLNLRQQVWKRFLNFKDNLTGDQSYYTAAEKYKLETNLTELQTNYLDMVIDVAEIDYIGESDELNIKSHSHNGKAYPTHYMGYRGVGYGNVASSVASPIMPKVRFNSKVTHVNQEDENDIVVKYVDENGETKEVTTRAVLSTVSLGVLKAGTINFTPSLPQRKQEVINGMGFGSMNKVVLMWDNEADIVWPKDKLWFNLITPTFDSSGKFTTWYNPYIFKTAPVLVGWIGGDEAKYMENQSDEEVINDALTNLRQMFPNITSPDRVLISRWGKEEHILGTYAFATVGRSFSNDMRILGERVGNVWFAGEATAGKNWYGTTAGKSPDVLEGGSLEKQRLVRLFPTYEICNESVV